MAKMKRQKRSLLSHLGMIVEVACLKSFDEQETMLRSLNRTSEDSKKEFPIFFLKLIQCISKSSRGQVCIKSYLQGCLGGSVG